MKEAEFGRCIESVLQPAIERNEQRYRDVDYDIVSGDGLVGTAASLQTLPSHKSTTFLRVCQLSNVLVPPLALHLLLLYLFAGH